MIYMESLMNEGFRLPLVIEPAHHGADLVSAVTSLASTLQDRLLKHGAVLFRGFAVRSAADFAHVTAALSHRRLDYTYRSTPRTSVAEGVFTATEYPPTQEIPLHNENAYQRDWPMQLALCCLRPAAVGGETPIADMRTVTARIGKELLSKFAALGVRYVRHYHSQIDLPWQTVFQTDDRDEVARFCERNEIAHRWIEPDLLQTTQACQGVASHPITAETIFFNQAHLFHVSALGEGAARAMIGHFGTKRLPRQAYFGNGDEIDASDLAKVRSAFNQSAVSFPWQAGDVLLLDNMQVAHGRRPFRGERQVLAALMNPYSEVRRAMQATATLRTGGRSERSLAAMSVE